ncbi:MAG: lauroyl acyltransferase [Deltaproteobacteria bacterium]|nr:MAG: lauroyl acyltransferase [Deltaproteobacteria bacterium]
MNTPLYDIIIRLTRWGGPWVLRVFCWFIATGYFLFFPKRVAGSVRFYRALFPQKNRLAALGAAFRQYQQFTTVFFDRYRHLDMDQITYTSTGWDYLQKAAEDKTGGIILMSHLGNWEMAAHFLQKKIEGAKILLFMGRKHREQVEKRQKDALQETGITIIAVDEKQSSPFVIVEGVNRLKAGEFVSLTGDRVWHPDQRTVSVDFLGHDIQLPAAPYILALMSHKPIYVFFSLRTGPEHYHLYCAPPINVEAKDRTRRNSAIIRAAQTYADLLADMARCHPNQWYHFTDFFK